MTTELSIFERPVEVPDDLREEARDKGWPQGLLQRARELRVDRGTIRWWLKGRQWSIAEIEKYLERRESLLFGTMCVREATWIDDEALADLYASSPEQIGDWEVTVERSPYPFAQFRLQEHASVTVLEDRGVILAATADSSRNAIVHGKRTTVHIASAWRVRKESRGKGYSHLLRMAGGPGSSSWFGLYNYYYLRSQNFGALAWIKRFLRNAVEGIPEREGDVPGIPVTAYHLSPATFDGDAAGIRLAKKGDIPRCVALINRTHRGQDLFRPYSREFLGQRLYDPHWAEKPEFWEPVYGWPDYWVLEDEGRVVACAGLWDKGRHVREVWRHASTGEARTLDCTALMDFGYAEGREEAMSRLIRHLVGLTQKLGRGFLVAPLEQLPALLEHIADLSPAVETRAMQLQLYNRAEDRWDADPKSVRPYTDLAYW